MAPIKKPSRRSHGRGKRKTVHAPPTNTNLPRQRRIPFEDDWEDFVDRVLTDMRKSFESEAKLPPYYKPSAVLERWVYKFVLRYVHKKPVKASIIENAIVNYRINIENRKSAKDYKAIREIRKPFEGNEFHWVLIGLQSAFTDRSFLSDIDYKLNSYDITRIVDRLNYAIRHNVPSKYLIGFLYQSGTLEQIREKAKNPNNREAWYREKTEI